MNDFYDDCAPVPMKPWATKKTTVLAPAAYAAVTTAPSDAQTKIEYLTERASGVFRTLDSALRKQFRLGVEAGPKTEADLIKAIQDGKFTLDEKKIKKSEDYMKDHGYSYGGPLYGVVFTDFPGEDRDGYHVAHAALKVELQKVKDSINIKDADTALAHIEEFEGWTYVAPTVH